jgi:hypothetical protein
MVSRHWPHFFMSDKTLPDKDDFNAVLAAKFGPGLGGQFAFCPAG